MSKLYANSKGVSFQGLNVDELGFKEVKLNTKNNEDNFDALQYERCCIGVDIASEESDSSSWSIIGHPNIIKSLAKDFNMEYNSYFNPIIEESSVKSKNNIVWDARDSKDKNCDKIDVLSWGYSSVHYDEFKKAWNEALKEDECELSIYDDLSNPKESDIEPLETHIQESNQINYKSDPYLNEIYTAGLKRGYTEEEMTKKIYEAIKYMWDEVGEVDVD